MGDKVAESMAVIEGADGPTSFFIGGKANQKRTLKQKLYKIRYDFRKRRIISSLKADSHTMDQVADYIVNEFGYTEIDKTDSRYQTEYYQMRASFLLQYQPELLGDLAELPKLENHDEESVKIFFQQLEQRQKAAEAIPQTEFDIDMHIYEKKDDKLESQISIEKTYQYIGGSASGSKRSMKKYRALYRKIYRYYGVSQEDIVNHTKRYDEVVKTLASI
ncbi:MAG: hypothetical protein ACI4DO_03720 [Roseburia sp.]